MSSWWHEAASDHISVEIRQKHVDKQIGDLFEFVESKIALYTVKRRVYIIAITADAH